MGEQFAWVAINITAVATLTKIIVDAVQLAQPNRPDWMPVALAFVAGPLWSVAFLLAQNEILTTALIAQSLIAGALAGGTAIGVTELQSVRKVKTDLAK